MEREETIAAIATAFGEGGIGIVRISGSKAKDILGKVFFPRRERTLQERNLAYGFIKDPETGEVIDEALAVFFSSPNTYTREDMAEINCHGSIVALRKTLDIVLKHGAVLASPGEFTLRAFLNGRIDLSQAEAVIDMIKAETDKGFELALGQLSGSVSVKVGEIRKELLDLLVQIAVNIEYPDEDIPEIEYIQIKKRLSQISDMIEKLLATADTGRIIKEGLKAVISGSPNVGKSSLLNALVKENRAIVTDIPGTTRDIIEETVNIRGIPVRLFDTAGIRSSENIIEKIGIEKSKEAFNNADLVLFMVDGSEMLSGDEAELLSRAKNKKVIVLINKIDINKKIFERQIREILPGAEIIDTSVTEEIGLEELEEKIEAMVYGGKLRQEKSLLITSARQKRILALAKGAIYDALKMTEKREALDFIEVDARACYELVGEITGDTVTDDIINEVFERFCLGK